MKEEYNQLIAEKHAYGTSENTIHKNEEIRYRNKKNNTKIIKHHTA